MNSWRNDEDISGNYLSVKEGEKLVVKVKEIKKLLGEIQTLIIKRRTATLSLQRRPKSRSTMN